LDARDVTPYLEILYKTALVQVRDEHLAEELVQETCLCFLQAVSGGAEIQNPQAYLLSVLRNRFFALLRRKYRTPSVYFGDIPEIPDETDFGGLEKTQEAERVRKALAFLTRTYREVLTRYYMRNESVAQIAGALGIPKGTVLSRLDAGRKKIKEGMKEMEAYSEKSYRPEALGLGMNGRTGQSGEPFSCVQGLLDQNILIAAYEEPLTVLDIAKALGTPTAFIEERVESLTEAQLMKRTGNKYAADFFIQSTAHSHEALKASKKFAAETFDRVHPILAEMMARYGEIDGFGTFGATQKYICAALYLQSGIISPVKEAATGQPALAYNDFPDRPNYGKWILAGTRSDYAEPPDNELGKYGASGQFRADNINDYIISLREWSTAPGPTHLARFKYSLNARERALLIDAVRTGTVSAFQTELLPDIEKYGFIKEENGKKVPAVPYITPADEIKIDEAERTGGAAFCRDLLDKAAKMCRENKIPYPKRIPYAEKYAYGLPLEFLSMAYVYEAAERGLITIEDGKYYPVMYLVRK
jgi:RNA polymerase sigma-70 factor (ECF subfamily)